jgi:hypothetical protein
MGTLTNTNSQLRDDCLPAAKISHGLTAVAKGFVLLTLCKIALGTWSGPCAHT